MESDIYNLLLTGISNQAFPMIITVYLLIRFEKKFESLTQTIQEFIILLKEEVL